MQARNEKWAALVDDVVVPLPQRRVKVRVIRAQANIPDGFVLVRDHNSPDDVVMSDDQEIDLADGNVFYRLSACDVQPRPGCTSPAKLAFFVNDRAEVTTNHNQTGQSLRDLFSIPKHARLVRDLESPDDMTVGPESTVSYDDGPVFYTHQAESNLKITVNSQVFTEQDGVKAEMSGEQIAVLVYGENPRSTKVKWHSNGDREVGHDEVIRFKGCDVFNVTRCEVIGGYEQSRVERELGKLREGGTKITLVTSPIPAVVFHEVPTRSGDTPSTTDVLVSIPNGYPGGMIDGAHLPVGSPLIGRVVGNPQGQITALDQVWQLISYHPHNGGGAPAWNPMNHGFHTYYGELLSWLHNAK
jgi:hypothetical protein